LKRVNQKGNIMTRRSSSVLAFGLLGALLVPSLLAQKPERRDVPTAAPAAPAKAGLTAEETRAGWKMLFDGKSLDGWRGYKKSIRPERGGASRTAC